MAFEFKIKLQGSSKPPIWRKVKVNENLTFDDFHIILQLVFDWGNSHLYQFSPKGYGSWPNIQKSFDGSDEYFTFSKPKNFPDGKYYVAEIIKLKDYFKGIGQKMIYIYDFGDSWEHLIELTSITDETILRPQCLGGKSKAPIDDCGGMGGYYNMVDAINDPNHPEHEDFMEWLGLEKGQKWEENEFDLAETNGLLQEVWDEWERQNRTNKE